MNTVIFKNGKVVHAVANKARRFMDGNTFCNRLYNLDDYINGPNPNKNQKVTCKICIKHMVESVINGEPQLRKLLATALDMCDSNERKELIDNKTGETGRGNGYKTVLDRVGAKLENDHNTNLELKSEEIEVDISKKLKIVILLEKEEDRLCAMLNGLELLTIFDDGMVLFDESVLKHNGLILTDESFGYTEV